MAPNSVPSVVVSLVPSILQFVETIFSHTPNSGAQKFGAAVNLTQSALTAAAAAGAIPSAVATDVGIVAGAVQSSVDQMKSRGQLGGYGPRTNVAKPPTPVQGPKVHNHILETVGRALHLAGKGPDPALAQQQGQMPSYPSTDFPAGQPGYPAGQYPPQPAYPAGVVNEAGYQVGPGFPAGESGQTAFVPGAPSPRPVPTTGPIPIPGPGGMQPVRDDSGNVKSGVQPNQSTTSILDAKTAPGGPGLIGKPKQSWEK